MQVSIKPLVFAAILLTSPLARAQTPPAVNTVPSKVEAGNYTVEPTHARLLFSVSHLGFTTWYGEFTGISGTLKLDPTDLADSMLDITIPSSTVTTTNTTLDGELKGAEWFDVAKYPTITFKSTSITRTSDSTADINGQLTFHGVTLPETLHATFNGSGINFISKQYTVGFNASGDIKRSAFGVKTYVPVVGDDVALTISVPFVR